MTESGPRTARTTPRGAKGLPDQLRQWLASGALQAPSGAYCAWRTAGANSNSANGRAFEYPEITGYALTWLAGRPTLSARESEAGMLASAWLEARLAAGDRSAKTGWDDGRSYTFDLGMIGAGLISFGRRVGRPGAEQAGLDLAAELAERATGPNGLRPLDSPDATSSRDPQWSTVGRAHLLKCVQVLLLAGHETAAQAVVNTLSLDQGPDGRFSTQPGLSVMLHPHFYAVEGLWIWGTASNDGLALERARLATEWAWDHQLESGGFPRRLDPAVSEPIEQCDVTAQALRAAILTEAQVEGLDLAIERLFELRVQTDAGAALPYQPSSARLDLNAWVTMFAAQGLELALDSRGGQLTWEALV